MTYPTTKTGHAKATAADSRPLTHPGHPCRSTHNSARYPRPTQLARKMVITAVSRIQTITVSTSHAFGLFKPPNAGDNRRAIDVEDEKPAYCESGSSPC